MQKFKVNLEGDLSEEFPGQSQAYVSLVKFYASGISVVLKVGVTTSFQQGCEKMGEAILESATGHV